MKRYPTHLTSFTTKLDGFTHREWWMTEMSRPKMQTDEVIVDDATGRSLLSSQFLGGL